MFWSFLFAIQTAPAAPPPKDPIVVKIIEPPSDPTGLAEMFVGVVRLTGVWVIVAFVCGAALAYWLFWYRARESERRP